MYRWLFVSSAIWPFVLTAQIDSLLQGSVQKAVADKKPNEVYQKMIKPLGPLSFPLRKYNLFASGELDYISGGILRSSTKVIEINIGDPDKFFIPLFIMVGATTATNNENLPENGLSAVEILNNYGGLISVGIDGSNPIFNIGKNTVISALYQIAGKSFNGIMTDTDKNIPIFSKLLTAGLRLDSKAWKNGQTDSQGKAWIKSFISYSMHDKENINKVFGPESLSNFVGSNIECGVDIQDFMAIKLGYYAYLNNQNIPLFNEGFYLFSADFNIGQD